MKVNFAVYSQDSIDKNQAEEMEYFKGDESHKIFQRMMVYSGGRNQILQ
jgi:hypothetical protein